MRWIAIAASVSSAGAALMMWAPWIPHVGNAWTWLALATLTVGVVQAVAAIAPSQERWFATGVATGIVLGFLAGVRWIGTGLVLQRDPGRMKITHWVGLAALTAAAALSLLMALRANRLAAPIPSATARARR